MNVQAEFMKRKDKNSDVLIEMRDVVSRFPLAPLTRGSIKTSFLSSFSKRQDPQPEFFEALSGVSLTVRKGERLGIIGCNGAGKSTILRTIAGIYPLHSGTISLNGRIRSIFDLGVGFEKEESGRRNIYYRGYLLGYEHGEITEIEQDIIAFAGLEEFIDMPLKAYSAGMQIRLAFAVSTAMGGSILLIDEVLAAGDAEFAVKAHARMLELIEHAACIIFVSHDLNAVKNLCTRALWIDHGLIKADGAPDDVIESYMNTN